MNLLQQNELLEVEDVNALSPEERKFEIVDINSLNWVFRKVSALKSKEKEIKQLANAERQRISDWERGELSSITGSLEFFENMVAVYHAQQLEKDPKAKTISTPYGKAKSRASKAAPEKVDESAILQFAIENGMDDCLKTSLKWTDFKKSLKVVEIAGEKAVVDADGQIVPGVSVKPESISFSVEV
ncbi:host-nuclease inhibitor Gam family protein [Bacillus infantis]|uniref:host-nuclease inhibitor Gam family protein n=1 Tax=Bacillus infantis TaxID=324767 RepID=UPI0039819D69